jgi:hypothetical protein
LAHGEIVGDGQLDAPESPADPCKRAGKSVRVIAIPGVSPNTAVVLTGDQRVGYIVGARCAGYERAERWSCILEPLRFNGVAYTGSRLEQAAGLELGDELGEAMLGGAAVTVRAIEGIEPSVAVSVEGRPDEVFVAPGVCRAQFVYQLDNDPATCLRSAVWFTFAPIGGTPGDTVSATSDRAAPDPLSGAEVRLERLNAANDAIPAEPSATAPVGTIRIGADGSGSLQFAIPDVPAGLYEAVIRCPGCAATFAGRTEFPAGSILVTEERSGSTGARIVYIALFAFVVLLVGAAVAFWRRGYRIGRRRRQT